MGGRRQRDRSSAEDGERGLESELTFAFACLDGLVELQGAGILADVIHQEHLALAVAARSAIHERKVGLALAAGERAAALEAIGLAPLAAAIRCVQVHAHLAARAPAGR